MTLLSLITMGLTLSSPSTTVGTNVDHLPRKIVAPAEPLTPLLEEIAIVPSVSPVELVEETHLTIEPAANTTSTIDTTEQPTSTVLEAQAIIKNAWKQGTDYAWNLWNDARNSVTYSKQQLVKRDGSTSGSPVYVYKLSVELYSRELALTFVSPSREAPVESNDDTGTSWVTTTRTTTVVGFSSLFVPNEDNELDQAITWYTTTKCQSLTGFSSVFATSGEDAIDNCPVQPSKLPDTIKTATTDSTAASWNFSAPVSASFLENLSLLLSRLSAVPADLVAELSSRVGLAAKGLKLPQRKFKSRSTQSQTATAQESETSLVKNENVSTTKSTVHPVERLSEPQQQGAQQERKEQIPDPVSTTKTTAATSKQSHESVIMLLIFIAVVVCYIQGGKKIRAREEKLRQALDNELRQARDSKLRRQAKEEQARKEKHRAEEHQAKIRQAEEEEMRRLNQIMTETSEEYYARLFKEKKELAARAPSLKAELEKEGTYIDDDQVMSILRGDKAKPDPIEVAVQLKSLKKTLKHWNLTESDLKTAAIQQAAKKKRTQEWARKTGFHFGDFKEGWARTTGLRFEDYENMNK